MIVLLPFIPSFVWNRRRDVEVRSQRPRWRKVWWSEGIAMFLFAGVLIYNTSWLVPSWRLSDYVEFPILFVRLEQYWGMFAPSPNRDDGWYVVEGRLRDGSKIEPFRETRQVSYDKPQSAGDFYPNERWRRYMMNIGTRDYKDFRLPLVRYLCSKWNATNSGPDHLEEISLFFMREVTPPPGQQGDIQKLLFFDYACSQ
jgi:hypothetical protein